jgi:hypothetical protein
LYHGSQREWHEVKGRLAACESRKGQEGTSQGNEPPQLLKIVEEGFAIIPVVQALRSATSKLPCKMVNGVFISSAAMSQKLL